jgi:hypothetical protein
MILGRSVIHWLILIFVAICVFILAKWLIPLVFGLLGVSIPDQIVIILSLLIALGCVWGGWSYNRGAVVP